MFCEKHSLKILLTDRLNVYIAAHAIILYLNKLLSIKAYGQSLYNSSDF